jgi:hypothetical protein
MAPDGGTDGGDPSDASSAEDSPATHDSMASDAGTDSGGSGPPPTGLIYYFPLAGDTNDHSGNGIAATNNGATHTTGHSGNANSAYLFDGSTNYMVVTSPNLVFGTGARTLTVWLKPTSATLQDMIVSWGHSGCYGAMFGLGTQQNATFWGGCDNVGAGLPVGAWTFVAAVFTPFNQMRVFINRTGTNYTLPYALNTPASSLWIGAETITNSPLDIYGHFAGAIDSIRIYNRALSDAEVATVMSLP